MSFTKPQVTIDLEEYNYLKSKKEITEEINNEQLINCFEIILNCVVEKQEIPKNINGLEFSMRKNLQADTIEININKI